MAPELDGKGPGHVEGFQDEGFGTDIAAEIDHANVEEGMAVAEVSQVYEIALVSGEDDVAELEVTVYGRIRVRGGGDEVPDVLLLRRREGRTRLQQGEIAVLDVLEAARVQMDRMQLKAHLREFGGILGDLLGMVGRRAGIGQLAVDAAEAYAVTPVFRDDVFARFRGGDARLKDLPGERHLVHGLPELAGEV